MKPKVGRGQRVAVWLGVACLGLAAVWLALGQLGLVPRWPLSAQQPQLRAILKTPGSVWSVAFSPDGRTLASGDTAGQIKLWDVVTGKERSASVGHTSQVNSVAFSPDGKTLASGGWDGIKLWDVPAFLKKYN